MKLNSKRFQHIRINLAAAVAALAFFSSTGTVSAEPRSWDGGGADDSWHNAANWNPDGVPTGTTDITFGSGITPGLNITFSTTQGTANSITIATTNSFTLTTFVTPAISSLTSGDVFRQDLAGTEGDHLLPMMRLGNDAVWNIAGQGTLTASIASSGTPRTFTKNGNGFLNLTTGDFGGAATINQGILRIGGFFTSPSVTVGAGTEFQMANTSASNTNVVLDSTIVFDPGAVLRNVSGSSRINQLTLGFTNPVHVDAGTLTINNITDGAATRAWGKNGPGTAILLAEGTYNGNTFVNDGTLIAAHSLALGTNRAIVAAPATLSLGNGVNSATPVDLAGTLAAGAGSTTSATASGPITLTQNARVGATNLSDTLTITGVITDNGGGFGLTKIGDGKVVLSSANAALGGTTVAEGSLRPTLANALPAGPVNVQALATLELVNDLTFNLPLQLDGPGNQLDGALLGANGNTTWSGPVTLAGNASIGAALGSTLTISSAIGGNFELKKAGDGIVRLTGPSGSFASLNIQEGTLVLASAGAVPAAAPITVAFNGTLAVSGGTTFNRTLTLNSNGSSPILGALNNELGNNTWSGPITLQRDSNISSSAGRLTISGAISGAHALTKVGPGEIALAGSNSYGDTFITSGFLTAQSSGALPANQTVNVTAGATLQFRGGVTTGANTTARLNGPGVLGQGALFNAAGNNNFAGDVLLVTDSTIGVAAGTTLTLSGSISDADPSTPLPLPLVKVGPGTLALTAANSLRAGTIVNGGTLSINSNARLGDVAGPVTLNNGAKLLITANTTSGRTFNLNTGSIQTNSGITLSYNGAIVSGGFLRGPGTHAIAGGSSFNGVTAMPDAIVNQNSPATLNNFTNAGLFTSNAPLTWDGGFNTGAGELIVNSTLSTFAFENDGQLTINNAATLTNSNNALSSTGGSRITINTGGTLNVTGNSLDLNGALLVNNGTISGPTNVNFGSLAKGSGVFGGVNVTDGGKFSPGNSPGTVTTGSTTWNSGGSYVVEIADALAGAGIGWDTWNINGTLNLHATNTTNGRFNIALSSMDALAANFDPQHDYDWVILHTTDGISNFDPSSISLDTSGFKNDLSGGHFSIISNQNDLSVHFTSVPEPALAISLLPAIAFCPRLRKRFQQREKI
jgi:autotransporter-associated beta strand protein